MKKRILVPIVLTLTIATIVLIAAILKLYMEAEKVQRSIFVSEVLNAGDEIINKIDATLKGDTLPAPPVMDSIKTAEDSSAVIFQKFAKKFLLDSASTKAVGVVKSTITYKGSDAIISEFDTIYFDATYKNGEKFLPSAWESDLDATVQFKENNKRSKQSRTQLIQSDLIEMDSNSRALLNRDFLNRIIKKSLSDEKIHANFDFALLNILTNEFVVEPAQYSKETLLNSEYIFTLKYNEKFSAPHYLILYFPSERGVFFQRMSTIAILIIVFLLIILIISGTTLTKLYQQKRVTEVKNEFINNITHEFKTPISTISLACEALSDENINDKNFQKTYIGIIQDENNRLKKMVNNILQLAKLNKGQLVMNLKRVDAHETIRHIVESVSLQISSNNGSLTLNLNADHPIILADPTHFEAIIINLIENAIKYTPKNPKIEITTYSDKKHLNISIKDNGIGISKQDQKKIFKDFYRVSTGNIHDTQGYGLGLGYVKKIVFLHGGFITVSSELQKGSIFTLHLPYKN